MPEQDTGQKPDSSEQFLDLLLDALLERQRARRSAAEAQRAAEVPPRPDARPAAASRNAGATPATPAVPVAAARDAAAARAARQPAASPSVASPAAAPAGTAAAAAPMPLVSPEPLPSIGMDRLLRRLLIAVAVLVVLVNIPVTGHGVSLARILPDTAALVIRDGLVLKGSGPEIYMLEDDQLRWISSLEALANLGLTWDDVHVVDDAFLARFEIGRPLDILYKCDRSPHVYVLQDGAKRWIRDIETFVAEGYVWEDVVFVECSYLRGIPDGTPIPPDAGAPPQP